MKKTPHDSKQHLVHRDVVASEGILRSGEVRLLIDGSEVLIVGDPPGLKHLAALLSRIADSIDPLEHTHLEPLVNLSEDSLWVTISKEGPPKGRVSRMWCYYGTARGPRLPRAARLSLLGRLPPGIRAKRFPGQ